MWRLYVKKKTVSTRATLSKSVDSVIIFFIVLFCVVNLNIQRHFLVRLCFHCECVFFVSGRGQAEAQAIFALYDKCMENGRENNEETEREEEKSRHATERNVNNSLHFRCVMTVMCKNYVSAQPQWFS